METVVFDFSFRAPASAKFKLRKRKKIKKRKGLELVQNQLTKLRTLPTF